MTSVLKRKFFRPRVRVILSKYGEWQWGIVEDDNWKNCDYINDDNTACYQMHSKKPFVGGCGSAEGITFIESFAPDCDRDCWTTKMTHFSSEFQYSDAYLRNLYYGYRLVNFIMIFSHFQNELIRVFKKP